MYGAGWGKQQELPELKPPETCGLCGGVPVEWYWIGFDSYGVYAETCDDLKCHRWLKNKVKKRFG